MKLLSVVVPAYNEKLTIRVVIEELVKVPNILEIVVVNDGSTDGTREILEQLASEYSELEVIHHLHNKGKTAALKTGFQATRGDIVIVQDADLEYSPQEIQNVIEPILDNKADVVYGSRFLVRKAARVLYFSHYMANKFLTFLSDVFTNVNITDVETCYKAFRGDIIRNMIIKSKGFGFEIEVTAKVAKLKCRIYEVPISYYGRTYEEGKKIGLKDGIQAIWYIIYFNLFCSLKQSFYSLPSQKSLAKTI
ncbi:glycosyltransferase family 2 protein [Nostoc sp. UHCC 0252]|uniref:glycosyltransferase family 2 protein n=1 Tax=Nostoc sp. UHCC 0252 TaxID=3110241 RepID=UPI002B211422|nr:glycosyltransferase family 2 protein [Nostoc sp. UHCC 0252]MEA5600741.1 glycosyltransferase family 2 protein [Nostoc sp. UHCC 0252]